MRFKVGDNVIKRTGGNKMTITKAFDKNDLLGVSYECVWCVDNMHVRIFSEYELVSLEEYNNILITEEREDKLNKILK